MRRPCCLHCHGCPARPGAMTRCSTRHSASTRPNSACNTSQRITTSRTRSRPRYGTSPLVIRGAPLRPSFAVLSRPRFVRRRSKARYSTKEDSHSAGRTNTSSLLHDFTLVGRGRWVDERLIERYRAEHAPIDRSVVRRAVAQKRAEAAAELHEPARRWPEWEALAEVRALHTVGGGVVLPPCG